MQELGGLSPLDAAALGGSSPQVAPRILTDAVECFHPKLAARPKEYIKDDFTRDVCLRLIDPKVNIERINR